MFGNLQILKGWRIMVFFFFLSYLFCLIVVTKVMALMGDCAFVGARCPIEVFSVEILEI